MPRLYDYPASQNGWKARALLALLKRPYETVWVPIFSGQRDPAFLKLNPMGAVPVLELEDGRALAESHAVLVYLAEGTPYLSADEFERAEALRWLFFEADYIQSSIATLRHWRLTGRADANAASIPPREATARRVLACLETHLQERRFLAADRLPSPISASMPMRIWPRRRASRSRPTRPSAAGSSGCKRPPRRCRRSIPIRRRRWGDENGAPLALRQSPRSLP
jgi:glutathione S-transferase